MDKDNKNLSSIGITGGLLLTNIRSDKKLKKLDSSFNITL
jgi:hypothetical protein